MNYVHRWTGRHSDVCSFDGTKELNERRLAKVHTIYIAVCSGNAVVVCLKQ